MRIVVLFAEMGKSREEQAADRNELFGHVKLERQL